MKKASKRGKNKAAPGFRATLLFWYQAKKPIIRFVCPTKENEKIARMA